MGIWTLLSFWDKPARNKLGSLSLTAEREITLLLLSCMCQASTRLYTTVLYEAQYRIYPTWPGVFEIRQCLLLVKSLRGEQTFLPMKEGETYLACHFQDLMSHTDRKSKLFRCIMCLLWVKWFSLSKNSSQKANMPVDLANRSLGSSLAGEFFPSWVKVDDEKRFLWSRSNLD